MLPAAAVLLCTAAALSATAAAQESSRGFVDLTENHTATNRYPGPG